MVHRAADRWPPTYNHVRTATYVRPVPDSPESKPHPCRAAGAQGHWPLATYVRTTTYVRPRTYGLFQNTGIDAKLLRDRWSTGTLAAGHLHTTTHILPRTYGLFQIHRNRNLGLAGPWSTGPLAAGHLRTTTYARPVPDAPESKPGSCRFAGAQGRWPLATYVQTRTHDNVRTTKYVRPVPHAPASMPGSCSVAGAQGLLYRWPFKYDHVRTACSRFTGIEARLLQGRCTQGRWPLAIYL